MVIVPYKNERYFGIVTAINGDQVTVDVDCRTDYQELVTVNHWEIEIA